MAVLNQMLSHAEFGHGFNEEQSHLHPYITATESE